MANYSSIHILFLVFITSKEQSHSVSVSVSPLFYLFLNENNFDTIS